MSRSSNNIIQDQAGPHFEECIARWTEKVRKTKDMADTRYKSLVWERCRRRWLS